MPGNSPPTREGRKMYLKNSARCDQSAVAEVKTAVRLDQSSTEARMNVLRTFGSGTGGSQSIYEQSSTESVAMIGNVIGFPKNVARSAARMFPRMSHAINPAQRK